jgi:RNA polymerase sigma factor (sigma-70 family)
MSDEHNRGNDHIAPWLDALGRAVADERLKNLSQSWSKETWEAYLSQIEFPLREKPVRNLSRLAENQNEAAPNYFYEEAPPSKIDYERLSKDLRRAMKVLTPTESKVIHLIFWRGLTERLVAKKMGIRRFSVQSYLKRALKKLRENLPTTLPLIEGVKSRRRHESGVAREPTPSRARRDLPVCPK